MKNRGLKEQFFQESYLKPRTIESDKEKGRTVVRGKMWKRREINRK